MKIDNNNVSLIKTRNTVGFMGIANDSLTTLLRTLDTNPVASAVGVDLVSMVAPRTYIDTKERNKYAGMETFFREFTGTLIVCLSAGWLAKAISSVAGRILKVNPKSWFSENGLRFLSEKRQNAHNSNDFIFSVIENISGKDGKNLIKFSEIDWGKIEWVEPKVFANIKFQNNRFNGIQKTLTNKASIVNLLRNLIEDKGITASDRKKLLDIISFRMTNALKAEKVFVGGIQFNLRDLLRDIVDIGAEAAGKSKESFAQSVSNLSKMGRIRSLGAISIAATLGLFNQYINRKITEKRTGVKGFVGDSNYSNQLKDKKSTKDNSLGFMLQKIAASAGMALMAIKVMGIKSFPDFLNKLEFSGPTTGGNAIKTIYASTLIGRFLASDNKNELTETVVRDYLGFLNWLVLGDFVAKGVANILDKTRSSLFNIFEKGSGIKHWLKNISLKSHNEIAAQGLDFAKKNMWKRNLAQISGLIYSTVALGIILPKINIWINKKLNENFSANIYPSHKVSFDDFLTVSKKQKL